MSVISISREEMRQAVNACSPHTICANNTLVAIFQHEGVDYAITSGKGWKWGDLEYRGYRLEPAEISQEAGNYRYPGYHGWRASYQGKNYVLVDPEITFAVKEEEKQ